MVLASTVTTATTASTQSAQNSSSSSTAGNSQPAVSTTSTSTNAVGQSIMSLNATNQRLAADEGQPTVWERLMETTDPSVPDGTAHSTTTHLNKVAEDDPMLTPVEPAREPGSIQTPVDRTGPLQSPSNDEFDAALEQVSAIMRKGRIRPSSSTPGLPAETTAAAGAVSSVPALVGTAAVGAVGYRLVLQSPDDEKRRTGWYARFPRR